MNARRIDPHGASAGSALDSALRGILREVVREVLHEELGEVRGNAPTRAQPEQPTDLLSVGQVAAMLGVHTRTVRAWIQAGDLRTCRAGRRHRIYRRDLEAFLEHDGTAPRRTDQQSQLERILRTI